MNSLVTKYNSHISSLFKLFKKKMRNNIDLMSFKNKLSIIKWVDPKRLIEDSKMGIWENREYIINRDLKYLYDIKNMNIVDRGIIKIYEKNIEKVKKAISNMNPEELKELWHHINSMLVIIIEYNLINI